MTNRRSAAIRAVMALLVLPVADAPAFAAQPGEIVFSVKRWDGDYATRDIPGGVQSTPVMGSIYSVAADGSNRHQIVELGRSTDYPTFSADGRWIYLQSNDTGHSRIYRCRADGNDVTVIGDPARLGPQWKDAYGYALSRDASKLLYVVHDGSSGRIVVANVDGSRPRLVASELGYLYMASFDPAGERIVCSGPATGYRLKLITLADDSSLDLTPNHPESFVPQFLPDGKSVIFLRRDGDIYRVDTDGRTVQRLTEGNHYVEFRLSPADQHGSTDGPRILPDGNQIAYIAMREAVANVCLMNVDGTGQRQITHRKVPCGRVRWSPDSRRLTFVSFVDKYPQLFIVAVDGGEPVQLTNLDGAVYFHEWRP